MFEINLIVPTGVLSIPPNTPLDIADLAYIGDQLPITSFIGSSNLEVGQVGDPTLPTRPR